MRNRTLERRIRNRRLMWSACWDACTAASDPTTGLVDWGDVAEIAADDLRHPEWLEDLDHPIWTIAIEAAETHNEETKKGEW